MESKIGELGQNLSLILERNSNDLRNGSGGTFQKVPLPYRCRYHQQSILEVEEALHGVSFRLLGAL